mgnify:CR=1 FL=1
MSSALPLAHAERPRTNVIPADRNHGSEQRVAEHEDPGRRLVVQQSLKPVSDERSGVGRIARALSQSCLDRGQRTQHAKPGLQHNDSDCQEVSQPEPGVAYPRPVQRGTAKYQQKAENDEQDKQRVDCQYQVCGDVIKGLRTHVLTPGLIIHGNRAVAMARKQQVLHNHLTIIGRSLIV